MNHRLLASAACLCLATISACASSDEFRDDASDDDRELAQSGQARTFLQIPGQPVAGSPSVSGRTVEVHLTNPWDTPTHVDLQTHHPTDVVATQSYDLAPHSTRVLSMGPRGVQSYQVEVLSSAPVASVVRTQWTTSAGNKARAMHNATTVLSSNVQYCGEVAYTEDSSPKQRAELTISNLTGDINSATVEFFEGTNTPALTKPVPLAAYQTVTLSTDSLGLPAGDDKRWIGSAKVTGTRPLTAVVNKINRDNGTAYNCTSGGSTAFSFPEFKQRRAGGSWRQWNVASIQNVSNAAVTVTATFSDGTVEKETLDPSARWALNASNGFPKAVTNDIDFNGTLDVTATGNVAVLNTTQIRRSGNDKVDYPRGGQYALPNANEAASRLAFPQMSLHNPDDDEYEFGHITLFNPSTTTAANITVRFFDRSGNVKYTDSTSIPKGGNIWYNNRYKADLRADLEDEFDGSILVDSDLPIQGVMQGLTQDKGQVNSSAIAVPDPPQVIVSVPDVKATMHIEPFAVQAMCDEQMAPFGWACDNSPAGLVTKSALLNLKGSANPDTPTSFADRTAWLEWFVSKEYRGWQHIGDWELQCSDGKVDDYYRPTNLWPFVHHSYGYTRGPLGAWFAEGDVFTEDPYNGREIRELEDGRCVEVFDARASRLAHAERVAVHTLLGYDQPFVWQEVSVVACCDGSVEVKAQHSTFPESRLFIEGTEVDRNPGEKLGQFMKEAGTEWSEEGHGWHASPSSQLLDWSRD